MNDNTGTSGKKYRTVCYLNQFFGQIGGEDAADAPPTLKSGAIGAAAVAEASSGDIEVVATVICGDNYAASTPAEARDAILEMLEGLEFDVFLAGPAFAAGRYGVSCVLMAAEASKKFGVPAVTSMNAENPGVEMYRSSIHVMRGGRRASNMKEDMGAMVRFALKLLRGEKILPACVEGYFPTGVRGEIFLEDGEVPGLPVAPAAERAVNMLLAKIAGDPWRTELPIPETRAVTIAKAVPSLREIKLALVSSGGIVPSDNPDRIESCSATKWGKYPIAHLGESGFPTGDYKTIHAGFDPTEADKNPNVIVPLDAIRYFQRTGRIGEIEEHFYTTVGTGTTQAEASRMGREIAADLMERGVEAVLLTAT